MIKKVLITFILSLITVFAYPQNAAKRFADTVPQLWNDSANYICPSNPADSNLTIKTPTNNFNIRTLENGALLFGWPLSNDTWRGVGTGITAKGAIFFGTSDTRQGYGNYQPVEINGSLRVEGNLLVQGTTFDTLISATIAFPRNGRIYCGGDSIKSYQLRLMNNASVKDSLGIGTTSPHARLEVAGTAIIDKNLTLHDTLYINGNARGRSGTFRYVDFFKTSNTRNSVLTNIHGNGVATWQPSTFSETDTIETTRDVNHKIKKVTATTITIFTGTAPPAITPVKVGDEYVDTHNKKIYFATGTSNSSDWMVVN